MKNLHIYFLAFIIIFPVIFLAGLYQYLFGAELHYDKYHHLFIYVNYNKYPGLIGEVRIGKNLFCMDNVIQCRNFSDRQYFRIMPYADTLYLYSYHPDIKLIRNISYSSIPIKEVETYPADSIVVGEKEEVSYYYGFVDSTAFKACDSFISIGGFLVPSIAEKNKDYLIQLPRLF